MKKVSVAVMIAALVILSTLGYVSAHSINVDGSPTDWKADITNQQINTWQLYSSVGEYVWKDNLSDQRYVKILDGKLNDWSSSEVIASGNSVNKTADISKFYVSWNDYYLYIAIETDNTGSSSSLKYGVGIDTDYGPGDTGYTGSTDAWGTNVEFSAHPINYELYGYWNGSTLSYNYGKDQGMQLVWYNTTKGSWVYNYENNPQGVKYTTDSNGVKTIEIEIPWSALGGKPTDMSKIAVVAWIANGNNYVVSSAAWNSAITGSSSVDLSNQLRQITLATPNPGTDSWCDLTQFRVTSDSNYVYFLIELRNLSAIKDIGMDGAPFIAIAINDGTGTGTAFAGNSDTNTYNSTTGAGMRWKYQVVINIAASNYTGKNINTTIVKPDANWGALFYITNDSWKLQEPQGALAAVSLPNNAIEIRLPRSMFANDGDNLEFELMVANGWSNYAGNGGGTWGIGGSSISNAVDVMTNVSGNTWNEVKDQVVDYYVKADITQVPFYHSLLAVMIVVLAGLWVFRRR